MNAPNHRRFEGGPLVIASHNPGKVREIADLLQPFGTEVTSAADLGLAEPIETGTTFAANAELKARAAADQQVARATEGVGVEKTESED